MARLFWRCCFHVSLFSVRSRVIIAIGVGRSITSLGGLFHGSSKNIRCRRFRGNCDVDAAVRKRRRLGAREKGVGSAALDAGRGRPATEPVSPRCLSAVRGHATGTTRESNGGNQRTAATGARHESAWGRGACRAGRSVQHLQWRVGGSGKPPAGYDAGRASRSTRSCNSPARGDASRWGNSRRRRSRSRWRT